MKQTFILLHKVGLLKRHNVSYWIDLKETTLPTVKSDLSKRNRAIPVGTKKYKITEISGLKWTSFLS